MTQIQVKCTLCKILSVLSSSYSALPVVSGFCAFDKLRYVYGRQSCQQWLHVTNNNGLGSLFCFLAVFFYTTACM